MGIEGRQGMRKHSAQGSAHLLPASVHVFQALTCAAPLLSPPPTNPCPVAVPPAPPASSQAVPMLFLWETKRKDRLEVFAHHVATIVLISYSYYLK